MNISIIGIGSWGTALGILLSKGGHEVTIYGRAEDKTEEIRSSRRHPFLPDIQLPLNIRITMDLKEAAASPVLVMAVPSPYYRKALSQVVQASAGRKTIVNVAKGFEMDTGKRLSEITAELAPDWRYCILSGPTHAEEVARDLPAAIVAASQELETAMLVQEIFNGETLRVYTSEDILGVEVGGSYKNVVAIGAGIVDGLGFGDNAKAGLITRGLHEMKVLGRKLGARGETFDGLTGTGDLIVTCMSRHSRNRGFGERLGQGEKAEDILASTAMVTEGVYAAKAFYQMNQHLGLDLPINQEVYKIIYEHKDPKESFKDLMSRQMKMERD